MKIKALTAENGGEVPKSLVFFHIPLVEYKDAWQEYVANGRQDTENVKLIYGNVGEKNDGVFPAEENCGLFDVAKELGSTQGFFCGHDHLNNFCLNYKGISKNGANRGCTVIDIYQDGSYTSHLESYYQDKYVPVLEKETVSMDKFNQVY